MENLKKSIMGKYNAKDVDMLLMKVRSDYEKCLKEQKERLIKLREDNREMSTVINTYKQNERYIIDAISSAEQAAKSIIYEAEQKAKGMLETIQKEEKSINVDTSNCYLRLCNLQRASEAIFRAVERLMGDYRESEKTFVHDNIRLINTYAATRMTD